MALSSAMTALDPKHVKELRGFISEANSNRRLVSGWEAAKKYMLQHGLSYMLQVPPQLIGISMVNRSGALANPAVAHWLGAKIAQQGFAFSKTNPVAIEAPVDDVTSYNAAVAANQRLCAISKGKCPPLEELKYLSVGAGHTNIFLRALRAKAPTLSKKLADDNGNVDTERLLNGQPELKEAVEQGLRWMVISRKVGAAAPEILKFAQRALNTDAREAVHETEVLPRLAPRTNGGPPN